MWLSARKTFRVGDSGWSEYIDFIQLHGLIEVRSIDGSLNGYVDDSGALSCGGIEDVTEALSFLPPCLLANNYHQLAINLSKEPSPKPQPGCILLGYDLSDETQTSSLLNCGPWLGLLNPFTPRLNHFGLLSLDNAKDAQEKLLLEWGENEPHAHVDIWELYETKPAGTPARQPL